MFSSFYSHKHLIQPKQDAHKPLPWWHLNWFAAFSRFWAGKGAGEGCWTRTGGLPSNSIPSQHTFHTFGSRRFWAKAISLVITQQCPSRNAICQIHVITQQINPLISGYFPPEKSVCEAASPPSQHTASAAAEASTTEELHKPHLVEETSLNPVPRED